MSNHIERLPALFLGHGSPMNAVEDNAFSRTWRQLGQDIPRPQAILCLSAHYAGEDSQVVALDKPPTIHDFYGFPQALFDVRYPAPGSPALARRVEALLPQARAVDDWGLDHGAWGLLVHMYPQADIPVVQLSLDLSLSAGEQLALGRTLRPLRDEGVLILGSGNVVHNLRRMSHQARYPWAQAFDDAVAERLLQGDRQLEDYMALPGAKESVPTNEHFVPLLYILGASYPDEALRVHNRALTLGSISMTGYQFGS